MMRQALRPWIGRFIVTCNAVFSGSREDVTQVTPFVNQVRFVHDGFAQNVRPDGGRLGCPTEHGVGSQDLRQRCRRKFTHFTDKV